MRPQVDPHAQDQLAVVSRRRLLRWTGTAGSASLALGALGDTLIADSNSTQDPVYTENARLTPADARVIDTSLPMGLAERVPAFGTVITFDFAAKARSSSTRARQVAIAFLREVTSLARSEQSPAAAADLRPANLQITPGFGATFLTACGLGHRRPPAFVDLPSFPTDRLDPALCGGDIVVQVGSEDPLKTAALVDAMTAYIRTTFPDDVKVRWSRPGFRSTPATAADPMNTTRNLMGHRDGTGNPPTGSPLWKVAVAAQGPDWMTGGSYLIARQIRIDLEAWYQRSESDRDNTIGRRTSDGAALGQTHEQQKVDLGQLTSDGKPVIPAHAHIRLANPQNTSGARIYRRSWNFEDGASGGDRRSGMMFLAWQADPRLGFIPIQHELVSQGDALNQFTTHVGSAVFAMPAQGRDEYVGQHLLEDS